jgi:hypothetical protein
MDYFSESYGFGEYKTKAIQLLKTTLKILDEFEGGYFRMPCKVKLYNGTEVHSNSITPTNITLI